MKEYWLLTVYDNDSHSMFNEVIDFPLSEAVIGYYSKEHGDRAIAWAMPITEGQFKEMER